VPIQAEKIPFEPDLGNASVGNGGQRIYLLILSGAISLNRVWSFFIAPVSLHREGIEEAVIMKKIVFILSGGELGDPSFFREEAAKMAPAAMICADGGARHLLDTDMAPSLIVGDMDSLDQVSQDRYESMGARIIRHPKEKNETDTELALKEAFAMTPSEIWIWGALGHRIDHSLANISLLIQGNRRGIEVKLIDPWCEVFLITRRMVLDGEVGQTVSILPFGGSASGITLRGFEYPLAKALMEVGNPYGVSNRLTERQGIIEVNTGVLLAVRYFRPGVFPGEERR
jgi:thiamine pyrophosphokinase